MTVRHLSLQALFNMAPKKNSVAICMARKPNFRCHGTHARLYAKSKRRFQFESAHPQEDDSVRVY